jgi:hypothetical protein
MKASRLHPKHSRATGSIASLDLRVSSSSDPLFLGIRPLPGSGWVSGHGEFVGSAVEILNVSREQNHLVIPGKSVDKKNPFSIRKFVPCGSEQREEDFADELSNDE